MDAIDRAICKGLHITDHTGMKEQTWKEFEKDLCGRPLFLFGVSAGIRVLLKKYGDRLRIAGVVDNDEGKQGFRLKDFVMVDGKNGDLEISNTSVLNHSPKPV